MRYGRSADHNGFETDTRKFEIAFFYLILLALVSTLVIGLLMGAITPVMFILGAAALTANAYLLRRLVRIYALMDYASYQVMRESDLRSLFAFLDRTIR